MLQKDYTEKLIMPSEVIGKLNAPTSKNLTQRAIIAASLANGISELSNINYSNDVKCFIDVFEKLNVKFEIDKDKILVDSRNLKFSENTFNCGESAFCVRTMSVILSLVKNKKIINGSGTLLNRDFTDILQLNKYGIYANLNNSKLPLFLEKKLKYHNLDIDGSHSSQLISGLLFALPIMDTNSVIKVINPVSIPYLNMTLDIINKFGVEIILKRKESLMFFEIQGNQKYNPVNINLENDWSNTSILLVIGAIAGKIEIDNIKINSVQGDKAIIDILKSANAEMIIKHNSIIINKSKLKSFKFDAKDNPDLVPALIILALKCDGISIIEGISRLKNKESDRVNILSEQLSKFGADIQIHSDKIIIKNSELSGGVADSNNDHRIAMALAAAGLISRRSIEIKNANSVIKSFPEFWDEISKICK